MLAACSDLSGPSLVLPSGQMHVAYDAGTARTLDATGALRLSEGRVSADGFAAAGQNAKIPEKLTVVGFTPYAENGSLTGRVFAITIASGADARTMPIDENCRDDGCSATLFFDGVTGNDPHREVDPDVDRACILTTGTVTVTTRTVTRIAGTFSGTGYCVFDVRYDAPTPFTVYSGSFDVPIDRRYQPRIDLY